MHLGPRRRIGLAEIESLMEALMASDLAGAARITQRARERGLEVEELYSDLIQPAMYEVGDRWREGVIGIEQEHFATATALRLLGTLDAPAGQPASGVRARVLLACVEGERHALGLQMLADSLERKDLEVMNLGPDVPTDSLLRAVRSLQPDVLCLSVSLRLQLPTLFRVIRALHGQDLRVAVGGQGVPAAMRESAPWACSLKELPDLGRLPRPAEILAILEPHVPAPEATFRAEESRVGEAAVEEARLEAEARRVIAWRGPAKAP